MDDVLKEYTVDRLKQLWSQIETLEDIADSLDRLGCSKERDMIDEVGQACDLAIDNILFALETGEMLGAKAFG
jgi:hypothetical protein